MVNLWLIYGKWPIYRWFTYVYLLNMFAIEAMAIDL